MVTLRDMASSGKININMSHQQLYQMNGGFGGLS
jgi:hypothetical protein